MSVFLENTVYLYGGINLMKKPDVIKQVANVSGLTQGDSNKAVKALVKVIQTSLKNGEVVSLSGLGSFRAKSRKARQGRNPKTGEVIPIPPGKKVSFKPTTTLRRTI
ncbi:MAG: HU family DNA-binding protein [Endomicrobium sp.]|jgi:predicted histone-like DNA-binding protein|nr:HU family DNA-binding protein [Endomicrobium sp.]